MGASRVRAVVARGPGGAALRTVDAGPDLEVVRGSLERAERVGMREKARPSTHVLDVAGDRPASGRWLYDAASGDLVRLGVKRSDPVYRLRAEDKPAFERVLLGER